MMLVVGGAHSGKRTFVREKLGFAASHTVLRNSYARSTLTGRSSG